MEIREATANDWQDLRGLFLKLLKTDPGAFVDEYDEIASRPSEKWIDGLNTKEGKTFIVVDEGVFVGMGRINLYKEIPGVPVLHKLGVLPEYRGRGIAKKLVKAREEWARNGGAQKVRLYVVADRLKTIEFSKKNGYQEVEVLKDNVKKSDGTLIDVLVMEKKLI